MQDPARPFPARGRTPGRLDPSSEADPPYSRQLARPKWEIVAQRLALGDSQREAHRKAGYKSSSHSCGSSFVRKHPEIKKRAHFLREYAFKHQTDQQLVGRREILVGLLDNITRAKTATVVRVTNKDGATRETIKQQNFTAVNQAYKIIAEIEGHIVRRSESLGQGDPIADAGASELLQMIEKGFSRLGLDFDSGRLAALLGIPGEAQEAGPFGDGPGEEPAAVLQPVPEAEGIPRGRVEVQVPAADGSESGGEIGGGNGRGRDAPDGDLP